MVCLFVCLLVCLLACLFACLLACIWWCGFCLTPSFWLFMLRWGGGCWFSGILNSEINPKVGNGTFAFCQIEKAIGVGVCGNNMPQTKQIPFSPQRTHANSTCLFFDFSGSPPPPQTRSTFTPQTPQSPQSPPKPPKPPNPRLNQQAEPKPTLGSPGPLDSTRSKKKRRRSSKMPPQGARRFGTSSIWDIYIYIYIYICI